MSIDHVSAVLRLGPDVSGTDRLVLFVLAEAAGADTDECWPGIDTIRARAGLRQDKYVKKALGSLADLGLVEVTVNGCPDSRMRPDRRTNLYRLTGPLALGRGGARRAGARHADAGGRDAPNGGARRAAAGGRDAPPKPVVEPSTEPEVEPLVLVADAPSGADPFDAFWTAYPRGDGKPAARTAWAKAITVADVETIMAGLDRWNAYWTARAEPEFVPWAQKWLRQQQWNAAPPPLRVAPGGPRAPIASDRERPTGRVVDL